MKLVKNQEDFGFGFGLFFLGGGGNWKSELYIFRENGPKMLTLRR